MKIDDDDEEEDKIIQFSNISSLFVTLIIGTTKKRDSFRYQDEGGSRFLSMNHHYEGKLRFFYVNVISFHVRSGHDFAFQYRHNYIYSEIDRTH